MRKIDRIKLWIFIVIRLSVITAGIIAILESDWTYFGMSVLTILVMFVPTFLEKGLKLEFPGEFDIVIVIFIYLAIFLGDTNMFYDRFWWWDIMLHGISGLIIGNIGFTLISYLNGNSNIGINLSPVFVAAFSFCFALSIGAIWEIYEYAMDSFFGFYMQRGSLDDTMVDMILDALGALVFSIFGYFQQKGRISFISKFIGKVMDRNAAPPSKK